MIVFVIRSTSHLYRPDSRNTSSEENPIDTEIDVALFTRSTRCDSHLSVYPVAGSNSRPDLAGIECFGRARIAATCSSIAPDVVELRLTVGLVDAESSAELVTGRTREGGVEFSLAKLGLLLGVVFGSYVASYPSNVTESRSVCPAARNSFLPFRKITVNG